MAFIKDITANTITLCLENTLSDDYKWIWDVPDGLFPCQTEGFWNQVSYDGMRAVNCLLLRVTTLRTGIATIKCYYLKDEVPNDAVSWVTVSFSVDWDLSIKNCEIHQGSKKDCGIKQINPKELEYSWGCIPAAGPDYWDNRHRVTLPKFLQSTYKPKEYQSEPFARPHVMGEGVTKTYTLTAKHQGAGIITFTCYNSCQLFPTQIIHYYVSAQSDLSLHIDAVISYVLDASFSPNDYFSN